MRRPKFLILLIILCYLFSGCSNTALQNSPSPKAVTVTPSLPGGAQTTSDITASSSPAPIATPFDQEAFDKLSYDEKYPVRNVQNGISPTTGLPFDGEYHPIMIQMSTDPKAMPHWGIAQADIVYECINYGGGKTRLTCIFNDHTPSHVGSIRSIRMHHVDIWSEWRACLVFWGAQDAEGTDAISFFKSLNPPTYFNGLVDSRNFYRDSSRKAPHNGCTDLNKLAQKISEATSPATRSFLFDNTLNQNGTSVNEFAVHYSNNYRAGYVYNAAANNYTRYYNRAVQKDGNDGTVVTCSNIIVQKVPLTWYDGEGDRPVMDLYGSGECEVYTDGRCIKGTWYRPDMSHRTVYTDEKGREIALTPGVTFIQVVTPSMETEISG